jgi:hypothetical protein
MQKYAEEISPLAWMDLLAKAPIAKLQAFGVLTSLFLTRMNFKKFLLHQCMSNLVYKEEIEMVICRVLLVCDFPVVPVLPVPCKLEGEEDSQSSAAIVEYYPPVENELLIKKIFENFEFQKLPKVKGWDHPAMLLCDVDIDHVQNTVKTCAYLNKEAEQLWGYSSEELYNISTQRDIEAATLSKRRFLPSLHL